MTTEGIRRVMKKQAREAYVTDLRDGRKLRPATFKDKKKDAEHRRHGRKEKYQ